MTTLTAEQQQAISEARDRVREAEQRARADTAAARDEFRATVREAVDAGATLTSVGRCLGVSRQRVHQYMT